ncbi:hypothetical protein SLA2020_174580 [Shorea laevis]
MKFFSRQPSTLCCNLLAPRSPTPLKPIKNHLFLAHVRPSSSTDDIPNQFDLTTTHRRIPSPSPAVWNNFVGPNRANSVKRQGKYLKAFKTYNNYFDVQSMKEQVIEIPLDKVVISDDLEILVEAQLYYLNVDDDPIFPSNRNKSIDPIAELTDLFKTTLPFQKMIEEILLCRTFRFGLAIHHRNCYFQDKHGGQDFKIFDDDFRDICGDFFRHPGFEIDDHINKITAVWGVKCLYVRIRFYLSRDMMPTYEDMQLEKNDSTYKMLRQKTDGIIKAIKALSAHYKSIQKDEGPIIRTTKAIPSK